ncbi:DNA polymerase III subunit gamma/tau [uncultured Anaerococcus sp.]|uniref:DNA polymerase III subunit gamma/tau n=1 Tax=uncultured Anaerococcus sp. TaxID=293428 RepID=UPI0025CCB9B5|nr:DNA polymerase III subunit gamma/tau [uncultured Anaerococcus sp.]
MARALYREYRPKVFDQVLGQDKVINVLKNQIKNNNFSHAYLFAGERGCGKTSAAKIFAKAVNCLNPKDGSPCLECENCRAIDEETSLDVVEMDAASNRRIDDIRNLKDNVIYPPTNLKYKVYIIDEAHMITREAFNALLKIMEEPPKHLVFILATTEIDKIPKTILSRVQKFEFNKIDNQKIKQQIDIILKDQNVKMENEAIDLIIRKAKGAMRDALSILDQVLSFDREEFQLKDVEFILGSVDFEKIDRLVASIIIKDQKGSLTNLMAIREDGKSNTDIVDSLINYYRDLMVLKIDDDYENFENEERLNLLKEKLDKTNLSRILTSLDVLNEYSIKMNSSSNTDILMEVLVLRLIDTVDIDSLSSRIEKLERLEQSDIVDTINNIIDNKLKDLKVTDLGISEKNEAIEKTTPSEVKEEKIEKPVDKRQVSRNDNSEKNNLDIKVAEKIRKMIVSTSGTMLNNLFKDEGFNYIYKPKLFKLLIRDDFYAIFIETKAEDIEEKLKEILKEDVEFLLETGDFEEEGMESSKPETRKTKENIDKLREVFDDDLIIK